MWLIIINLFTGKLGMSNLSGPVGMYTIVESAKSAWVNIVYLTAYLSINLAVINIIQFQAFDGARELLVSIK